MSEDVSGILDSLAWDGCPDSLACTTPRRWECRWWEGLGEQHHVAWALISEKDYCPCSCHIDARKKQWKT